MAWNHDRNDYFVGYFGDIIFQDDDILDTFTYGDTYNVYNISLKQEIVTRIEAYSEDWQLYPDLGANMRDLIGTIADPEYVKTAGKQAITMCLTKDGLLPPNSLDVSAIKVDATTVIFMVTVTLRSGSMIIGFNFDLSDNQFRHIY